jgi:hypothetical protein
MEKNKNKKFGTKNVEGDQLPDFVVHTVQGKK